MNFYNKLLYSGIRKMTGEINSFSTKTKNKYYYQIVVVLILCFQTNYVYGQNKKTYISDGQDYTIAVKKDTFSTINVIFYPDIDYQISLNSDSKNSLVEMELRDSKGKLIYSNKEHSFGNNWHFKFKSLINISILFKLTNSNLTEDTIKVQIGYNSEKKGLIYE